MVCRDISVKGYEDLFCISLKNKSSLVLFEAEARTIKRKISQEVSEESNGFTVVKMCSEISDLKNICKYNHACP